jgi:PST family polysaccharide transporter
MAPDTGPAEAGRHGVFRHHVHAFFAGGILSFTRLAMGFVRIKYVALVLGTVGVGLLAQATQLQLLGISIASFSMGAGIINRMGAIGPANREREGRLLSTAFTVQAATSLALLIAAVVFAKPLIATVFGVETLAHSPVSTLDILAVVFSVPMSVVASGYLEAVFFGGGRYDLYVRASVWATILGFLATLAIIAVWRLPGAFWSVFVSSALLMSAFIFHVRRVRPLSHLFRTGFDWPEANALIRFSIAVLVSGALVPTARLWVNGRVIALFGVDANGLLAVPFAVNAYYAPFLTNGIMGRMHPAVTRVGASPEGRHELTTALRLTVGLATAAIAAILFLKDVLVPIAYSRAFLPAAQLLPMQLFGDYFYFVAFPFTVYALGISRLRVYLAAWVGYAGVAVAASLALIPVFGLVGVPAGYAISNAIGAVVAIAWLVSRREEGLATTLLIVAGGLVVVGVQSWLAWRGLLLVLQGAIAVVTGVVVLASLWRARNAPA